MQYAIRHIQMRIDFEQDFYAEAAKAGNVLQNFPEYHLRDWEHQGV
jgi:hypothetical protein